MLVVFSVVAFVNPSTRIAVVGSIPELGEWKPSAAIPLYPHQLPSTEYIPTYFSGIVELSHPTSTGSTSISSSTFRYKFIKWQVNATSDLKESGECFPLPPVPFSRGVGRVSPQPHSVTSDSKKYLYHSDQLRLHFPLTDISDSTKAQYNSPPAPHQQVTWEGTGPHHDRVAYITRPDNVNSSVNVVYLTDYLIRGSSKDQVYYALPPADFMDPIIADAGHKSEFVHTTRYYDRVRLQRCIHFNEIIPRLYCGSCPRRLSHLITLRDTYNVRTVFCLQSNTDVQNNWIDDDLYPQIDDRNTFTLQKIYDSHQVNLVHIPTEDMCTEARAAMMAQAAWLMTGVLVNRPEANVYVHCNAGVGRAIACVSAFLHFCLGLSETHTLHLIRSRRPVAYFDPVAVRRGKNDFDAKFGKVLKVVPVLHTSVS